MLPAGAAAKKFASPSTSAPSVYLRDLPAQPASLIGRQKELVGLKDLLRRDDVRLLTLTDAPGIGKTRLALQVASDLSEEFGDGACFVDLAPLRDPALILYAIERAVGVREAGMGARETGAESLQTRLVRSLRQEPVTRAGQL